MRIVAALVLCASVPLAVVTDLPLASALQCHHCVGVPWSCGRGYLGGSWTRGMFVVCWRSIRVVGIRVAACFWVLSCGICGMVGASGSTRRVCCAWDITRGSHVLNERFSCNQCVGHVTKDWCTGEVIPAAGDSMEGLYESIAGCSTHRLLLLFAVFEPIAYAIAARMRTPLCPHDWPGWAVASPLLPPFKSAHPLTHTHPPTPGARGRLRAKHM